MFVNSDFSDLLKIFSDYKVKYLVIGGYVVVQYAEPRFIKDLDVLISTDSTNAEAVYHALHELNTHIPLVLTHHSRPKAALISYDDYLRFQKLQESEMLTHFDQAWNRFVQVNAAYRDDEISQDIKIAREE